MGKTALAPLLVLSKAYGEVQSARRWAYRVGLKEAHRPGAPVISIGNITVGGTGKTPCVEMVCQKILAAGGSPAVLSRGYGGKSKTRAAVVSDGEKVLMTPDEAGDEPVLLATALPGVPVLIGGDRRAAADLAMKQFKVDVLVLDDGFQHLRLARDLNIITMDATNPFANGHCLPRGFLREKLSALSAADVVLLTRSDKTDPAEIQALKAEISRISRKTIPVLAASHNPTCLIEASSGSCEDLKILKGMKALAFAGIGNHEAFFKDLKILGAKLLQSEPFPDHHRYKQDELKKLDDWAELMNADAMLTTEKDLVRLKPFLPTRKKLLALRIELKILGQEELLDEMIRKAGSC